MTAVASTAAVAVGEASSTADEDVTEDKSTAAKGVAAVASMAAVAVAKASTTADEDVAEVTSTADDGVAKDKPTVD